VSKTSMDSVSKKTPDSMSKNPMDITLLAQLKQHCGLWRSVLGGFRRSTRSREVAVPRRTPPEAQRCALNTFDECAIV
ncbi:hypothetical protein QP999_10065, partial [Corynebacterium sp. MSK004]|uniref:hypothetical protein n=1 Tax=Corynebacterium sp. MSK004 TaxID=3050186 RepID=UPI002550392D